MGRLRTILTAGLLAGLFDIADAFIVFGTRGIRLMSIPQSIAAGLLGMDAFKGGWPTVFLGLGLHFAMAIVMAAVFYAAARLIPLVARYIVPAGLVYGLGLYGLMTYVVVPLSGFRHGNVPPFPPAMTFMTFNALFCHLVLVGTTIAIVTHQGLKAPRTTS